MLTIVAFDSHEHYEDYSMAFDLKFYNSNFMEYNFVDVRQLKDEVPLFSDFDPNMDGGRGCYTAIASFEPVSTIKSEILSTPF